MAKKVSINVVNKEGNAVCPICGVIQANATDKTLKLWAKNLIKLLKYVATAKDEDDVRKPNSRKKL